MNGKPMTAGMDDDDIILMSGLSVADERELRAHYAKIDERANRERMAVAARWAIEHGGPAIFDSKGWPVDAADWPLSPRQGVLHETMSDYLGAVTRAKSRRTRRANAARRLEAEAFDITKIELSGHPPFGRSMAISEERRHQQAPETAMPW